MLEIARAAWSPVAPLQIACAAGSPVVPLPRLPTASATNAVRRAPPGTWLHAPPASGKAAGLRCRQRGDTRDRRCGDATPLPSLQAAALAAQAVKREASALELPHPETGEPIFARLSKLYKPATRAALLHAVVQQGLAAPDIDDESVAQVAQMRRRFDAAGVPLQDVLVRFRCGSLGQACGARGWRWCRPAAAGAGYAPQMRAESCKALVEGSGMFCGIAAADSAGR